MARTTRSSSHCYSGRRHFNSMVAAGPAAVAALLLLLSAFVAVPVAYSQDEALFPPAPPDPTMAPGTSPPPSALSASAANANANATPESEESTETEITWSGCVDPDIGYQPVTIGQATTICLVLANNGDWSTEMDYMRLNFQPIADQYSRFHVPKSFQQLVGTNAETALTKIFPGNVTVHAESQTALSFQKLYYNGDEKVFPFLTAIVAVNEGNVTGITWDNACVFCAEDECQDNTYGYDGEMATEEEAQQPVGGCHSTVKKCRVSGTADAVSETAADADETVANDCDLMLYVVWTGTDSNGKDFKSSANRFSAFPKQSWTDRFTFPELPDFLGNILGGGDDGDQSDGDQSDQIENNR